MSREPARESADDSPGDPRVYIPDQIVVSDLAEMLRQKPFVIVSDLMKLGVFVTVRETVLFEVAAKIAKIHGFEVGKAN